MKIQQYCITERPNERSDSIIDGGQIQTKNQLLLLKVGSSKSLGELSIL